MVEARYSCVEVRHGTCNTVPSTAVLGAKRAVELRLTMQLIGIFG